MKLINTKDYLLLIDGEVEIDEGDYYYWRLTNTVQTNKLFIEDRKAGRNGPKGEVYKVIAYFPLTKQAKELDLPLLPNPFEEVDVEKLALEYRPDINIKGIDFDLSNTRKAFVEGYKAAQSKQFSLEDMKKAIKMARRGICSNGEFDLNALYGLDDLQEVNHKYSDDEIIQSLSTQQLPKKFIPEYINTNSFGSETNGYDSGNFIPKTITNSEGKQELVGEYTP